MIFTVILLFHECKYFLGKAGLWLFQHPDLAIDAEEIIRNKYQNRNHMDDTNVIDDFILIESSNSL